MYQPNRTIRQSAWIFLKIMTIAIGMPAYSQVCSNPVNVIYGVSSTGNIFPITVATGFVGAQVNAPLGGNPALNPNGIGYNSFNGRFYFFKRSPADPPQEFVSYDPGLGTTTILSSCPTPNIVYVGCMTADGKGYYCWDSQAQLFYYSVLANTWTLITTNIRDQFGKDVDSIFRKHGSGDAAIDGSGNMMMLPSSNSRFALYKMKRPLPTSPVASIVVTEVMPLSNPPGKFVGISLNSTGQIFMSTAGPNSDLYRLENNLSLTYLSRLSAPMDDLTSCNYPVGLLAIEFKNFSAQVKGKSIQLTWENLAQQNEINYFIQRSSDGIYWSDIGNVTPSDNTSALSFIDYNPSSPVSQYRIYVVSPDGSSKYSAVRSVILKSNNQFALYPNPVDNALCIQSSGISSGKKVASIFDQTGRKLKELELISGNNWIDFTSFPSGKYMLVIKQAAEAPSIYSFLKK